MIIPSEDGNYSPLIVDYHETQFLERLNQENRKRLEDPQIKFSPVPTNPIAFDRYSYVFNNPVKYTDPSGHCLWDLCIAEVAGVTIGVVEVGLVIIGIGVTLDVITPGFQERVEDRVEAIESVANNVQTAASEAAAGLAAIGLASKLPKKGSFPYVPPKVKGNPP